MNPHGFITVVLNIQAIGPTIYTMHVSELSLNIYQWLTTEHGSTITKLGEISDNSQGDITTRLHRLITYVDRVVCTTLPRILLTYNGLLFDLPILVYNVHRAGLHRAGLDCTVFDRLRCFTMCDLRLFLRQNLDIVRLCTTIKNQRCALTLTVQPTTTPNTIVQEAMDSLCGNTLLRQCFVSQVRTYLDRPSVGFFDIDSLLTIFHQRFYHSMLIESFTLDTIDV